MIKNETEEWKERGKRDEEMKQANKEVKKINKKAKVGKGEMGQVVHNGTQEIFLDSQVQRCLGKRTE